VSNNQQKRDLEWLINSPSLISVSTLDLSSNVLIIENMNDFATEFSGEFYRLNLDSHSENQSDLKCTSHNRLGHYAECLFEYWAEKHPDVELLDKGVQIRDATGQTSGELDFLLKINQQLVHLEMAVKFYLMADDKSELSSFVGPNPSDRFDLKYHKMVNQQSQWLQRDWKKEGLELETELSEELLNSDWQAAILLKGMIFIHWKKSQKGPDLPDEINEDCVKGEWCYPSEWDAYLKAQKSEQGWKPLHRLEWLSPARAGNESEILSGDEISSVIKRSKYPQMVAGLSTDEGGGHLIEKTRVVVVPDDWNQSN
jgi:hypothetical protein